MLVASGSTFFGGSLRSSLQNGCRCGSGSHLPDGCHHGRAMLAASGSTFRRGPYDLRAARQVPRGVLVEAISRRVSSREARLVVTWTSS
jgi:hypothetical protein